jgi:hypothetical protein
MSEVIDDCYHKLDNGNYVLGIYFDLQKAFDSISHDILLFKLYHYGIRGVAYDWFVSYLSDRKQYTAVNGVVSNTFAVDYGVPQGSVLGPLLFLLYINDLPRIVRDQKLRLFADDTNLFVSGVTIEDVEKNGNQCVQEMHKWFCCNRLTVNVSKTCMTLFSSKKKLV